MPADAPTAVTALNQINDAGRISGVGIIIHRPEIAVIVKGQFLRIAQTRVDDFKIGSVQFAAIDRARLKIFNNFTVGPNDMCAAIADGIIEPTVWSDFQSMRVVT